MEHVEAGLRRRTVVEATGGGRRSRHGRLERRRYAIGASADATAPTHKLERRRRRRRRRLSVRATTATAAAFTTGA